MKSSNASGTFNVKVSENGGPEKSLVPTTLYLDFSTNTLSVAGFLPATTQPDQGLECNLSGPLTPGVFTIGVDASAFYNTGKPGDSSWNAVVGKITITAVTQNKSASGEIEFTAQDGANSSNNAVVSAKFVLTNI